MEKYILGEISSSGGATLYKNPSDQTVNYRRFTIGNPPDFNSPNFSDWCWNLMYYIFLDGLWRNCNEELVIHCLKKLSGITDLENQISFEPLSYNQIMKLGPEILFFFHMSQAPGGISRSKIHKFLLEKGIKICIDTLTEDFLPRELNNPITKIAIRLCLVRFKLLPPLLIDIDNFIFNNY